MTMLEAAKTILDSMLGHLGFVAEITIEDSSEGSYLHIRSADSALIIGEEGERLEDIQYLVNRVLKQTYPDAERIRVDCEHFRHIQEEELSQLVKAAVKRVVDSKKAYALKPLNAYYRRLVYQFLGEYDEIQATSPEGDFRLKRITISLK